MTIPLKIAPDYKPYKTKSKVWYPGCDKVRVTIKYKKRPQLHLAKTKDSFSSEYTRASFEVGKTPSYFSNLRKENPDTFDIIHRLGDGDLVKGFHAWEMERKRTVEDMLFEINGLCLKEVERKAGVKSAYALVKRAKVQGIKRYDAWQTANKLIRGAREIREEM